MVGYWTDKHPMPWSLPIGMCFTLSGLVLLALAGSFGTVLIAAALVGTGSSVFHPESSRVARMASGGRHGLAQSIFRVGGNFGSSLGPLLAAVIIAPYGKGNVALVCPLLRCWRLLCCCRSVAGMPRNIGSIKAKNPFQ